MLSLWTVKESRQACLESTVILVFFVFFFSSKTKPKEKFIA